MIGIHALYKSYGKQTVLEDIHMSFMPGTVSGIVGKNGAGKTTLFKCISGLEAYSGDLTSNYKSLKNHIGYLPTEPFFFAKITGREYLQLCLNAKGLSKTDFDLKNIFELPLDLYASTYSTGMKKKLALTAILIQQNEVFILDEPFNGVDIQSNILINEIIHRLRSLGKTVILSSHIFVSLRDTCDVIHVLDQGRLMKTVTRDGFDALEHEMKDVMIEDRIDRLDLK